ncbi:MAG TPA: ABC transporter permease [Tardiphaga sp.]
MTHRMRLPDIGSLVILAGLLGIWEITALSGWISPVFLPPIEKAVAALFDLASDGTLLRAIVGTTFRMLIGFAFATLVGCGLGILIGLSPRARAYIEPSLEFLRPLPASAIIPVAILMLGLTKTMIIFVIAFGSLWPTLLATIQGIKSVEPRLFEMARTMELSQRDVIRTIVLPSALPDIFAGLRLGLTVSLILAVVTEMMSAEPGLGSIILQAARSFNSSDLFAGVMVLGALGFVINALMEQGQRRLMRWKSD